MAIVMITIIFPVLTMMVEIAVHLMEIIGITIAKHVNVSNAPIFGLRKNVKRTRTSVLEKQLRKIARVLANFAKNQ